MDSWFGSYLMSIVWDFEQVLEQKRIYYSHTEFTLVNITRRETNEILVTRSLINLKKCKQIRIFLENVLS